MKTIKQILSIYRGENYIRAKKLRFSGVGKNDVYNITRPFKFKRTSYILGRVEPHDGWDSKIVLFKKKKDSNYWYPDENFNPLHLEDPFIEKIGESFVVGGVEVQRPVEGKMRYRTVFYRGKDIHNLRKFSHGPWGMKDIRLVELPDKRIGVFTRPQGKKGGRGRIGFTIIDSLQKLKPRILTQAPLLKGQFAKGEWGGVNEAIILSNGKVGALGHIARKSKDKKLLFYYPFVFYFDPYTRERSNLRIILRRAELPEGESKKPELYNVVFPGGIIRKNKGLSKLYVGVGDAEAYEVLIKDPFEYYEEKG